jgi:hypothetical protein
MTKVRKIEKMANADLHRISITQLKLFINHQSPTMCTQIRRPLRTLSRSSLKINTLRLLHKINTHPTFLKAYPVTLSMDLLLHRGSIIGAQASRSLVNDAAKLDIPQDTVEPLLPPHNKSDLVTIADEWVISLEIAEAHVTHLDPRKTRISRSIPRVTRHVLRKTPSIYFGNSKALIRQNTKNSFHVQWN